MPARHVEVAIAQADDSRLQAEKESVEQLVGVDRTPARNLSQTGHRFGQLHRKLVVWPVGVCSYAHDRDRFGRARARGFAQDSGDLAYPAGHVGDDVVGPLETEPAVG